MTVEDILQSRLANQQLAGPRVDTPRQLVRYFGAIQAQDFGAAKWAVGQRLPAEATDVLVEQAFNSGDLLRTHVMRPTWHFVAPEDIRWLLALTAGRVKAASRFYQSALELDEPLLRRSNDVLAKALEGNKSLTRPELARALQQAGIQNLSNIQIGHILMNAELDAIICSGPRRGKQQTYALLDERAPFAPAKPREEALAELARRYFTSHGPATLRDFAWWSGLTVNDARRGVASNGAVLEELTIGEQPYWWAPAVRTAPSTALHLLPNFDEYTVAYTGGSRLLMCATARIPAGLQKLQTPVPLTNVIIQCGRVVGVWQRVVDKGSLYLSSTCFADHELSDDFQRAARDYAGFLGLAFKM